MTEQVYVAVDGVPQPIEKVTWIKIAPCGCISGAHMARSDMVVTEEQAERAFQEIKEKRLQDYARGFRLKAVLHESLRDMPNFMDCTHTPRWGYEETPIPEGYVWAGLVGYGDHGTRNHLVPNPQNIERDERQPKQYLLPWATRDGEVDKLESLCGRVTDRNWQFGWAVDMAECKSCTKKAFKMKEKTDG